MPRRSATVVADWKDVKRIATPPAAFTSAATVEKAVSLISEAARYTGSSNWAPAPERIMGC